MQADYVAALLVFLIVATLVNAIGTCLGSEVGSLGARKTRTPVGPLLGVHLASVVGDGRL